jgi:hypothetical protein
VGVALTDAKGRFGGIAYFDQSGKQTRFIDTGKYLPAHIRFDANQWRCGPLVGSGMPTMIFRKYSPEGKEMGHHIFRKLFPAGMTPGAPAMGA